MDSEENKKRQIVNQEGEMNKILIRKWIVIVLVVLNCIFTGENSFCSSVKDSLIESNEMELRAIRERAKILMMLFCVGNNQKVKRVHFRNSCVYELNDLVAQMNKLHEKGLPTRISPLPKPILLFIVPGIEYYSMGELILKSGQIITIIDLLLGEHTEIDVKGKGAVENEASDTKTK